MYDNHRPAITTLDLGLDAAVIYDLAQELIDDDSRDLGALLAAMLDVTARACGVTSGSEDVRDTIASEIADQIRDLKPSQVTAVLATVDYVHTRLVEVIGALADTDNGGRYADDLGDALAIHTEASVSLTRAIDLLTP